MCSDLNKQIRCAIHKGANRVVGPRFLRISNYNGRVLVSNLDDATGDAPFALSLMLQNPTSRPPLACYSHVSCSGSVAPRCQRSDDPSIDVPHRDMLPSVQ